ncbi:MAG: hypothetical protein RL380_1137 [Verrucomicrobiota bacterium]
MALTCAAVPPNFSRVINPFSKNYPPLTRTRGWLAVGLAVVADALQIPLQAIPGAPEVVDVLAMVSTTFLLGFHWLLLPTFLLEFVPLVDALPTWTGCVLAVIALRRKQSSINSPPAIDLKNPPPQ